MTRSGIPCFVLVLALTLGLPCGLAAAEPELLAQRTFDVTGDSSGRVEVSFTLALSEVSRYPVTITAISGATEEQLWSGSLSEGYYRLRTTLTKITGSSPLKVILKTTIVNRSALGNDSFVVYRKWEGTLGR